MDVSGTTGPGSWYRILYGAEHPGLGKFSLPMSGVGE